MGEIARKQQFWVDFLSNDACAPIVLTISIGEILHDLKKKILKFQQK